MRSKEKEKVLSRQLRKRGLSLKEIAQKLKVAKSSVSLWVKDVKLTKLQIRFLSHKVHLREIIEKRVETRLKNEKAKRQKIINIYKKGMSKMKISQDKLILLGSALYWAEGGKSDKNRMFNFYNSDPEMIKVMLVFLRRVCKIPEQKLRGHLHIHPHMDVAQVEKFWSNITNIPLSQFYKTNLAQSKASKNTRNNLPYGTFSIQICSTDLYLKMLAWIEAIRENTLKTYLA